MIKRTLYFGNPARLFLKDNQLCIELKSDTGTTETKTTPVEDLGMVVIDHPQITFTSGIIQALQENNVALLTCDARHMPQSLLLPLEGNTIQEERYEDQLKATEPLKKQLWAQTIAQKIRNQHAVLKKLNLPEGHLERLYQTVKSGDPGNHEAQAAAHYWKMIFANENGFYRDRSGPPPNNFLNYGYAILRAVMARSIVCAGLIPTLGIFHRNRYNAFCLADDLMEPYRPFVDQVALELFREFGEVKELEKVHKAELLKIPAMNVNIEAASSPLMVAAQRTATSLVKCFAGETRKLIYPELK